MSVDTIMIMMGSAVIILGAFYGFLGRHRQGLGFLMSCIPVTVGSGILGTMAIQKVLYVWSSDLSDLWKAGNILILLLSAVVLFSVNLGLINVWPESLFPTPTEHKE